MNKNRLYQVLLAPRVTEKTTRVGEDSNQYVLHVVKDANVISHRHSNNATTGTR